MCECVCCVCVHFLDICQLCTCVDVWSSLWVYVWGVVRCVCVVCWLFVDMCIVGVFACVF